MSAHGHNSISNCVRAARNGSEEASLFTELIHEPAPLKAKEQLLLQSLRAKGPHLQRKAAKAVAPRAAPAPAPAATQEAPRRVAPVAAKVFASKAERRHGSTCSLGTARARLLCLLRAHPTALGGAGTPGARPVNWARVRVPSHCLRCAGPPPPTPSIPPPWLSRSGVGPRSRREHPRRPGRREEARRRRAKPRARRSSPASVRPRPAASALPTCSQPPRTPNPDPNPLP